MGPLKVLSPSPPLPAESKGYLVCRSNPVIYGVMDVDWHYYLLIAPHSCSSPFEDQSGRVPLCAPTLINSQWTSIKANCSLCTSVALRPLYAGPAAWDAAEPVESFNSAEFFRITSAKLASLVSLPPPHLWSFRHCRARYEWEGRYQVTCFRNRWGSLWLAVIARG